MDNRGKCYFCCNDFEAAAITSHLKGCVFRKGEADRTRSKLRAFHVRVASSSSPVYWLEMEVDSHSPLFQLDKFLRDIWLECCSHLSAFRIGSESYESHPFDPISNLGGLRTRSMGTQLRRATGPGRKFSYEYDLGDTTRLDLEVVEECFATFPDQTVSLLARNNPIAFSCMQCDSPATRICAACLCWYCRKCSGKGDGEHFFLPIVNSPRMGICGYTGRSRDPFEAPAAQAAFRAAEL